MTKLAIAERREGDVTVLTLTGDIILDDGDLALRRRVHDLLDEGRRNIVLNLAGVTYIDSSGIGELVSCYTTIKNRGGAMRLARLNSKLYSLLQLTALVTVFDIYDSKEDALNGF